MSFWKSVVFIGHIYHAHCPHTGMGKVPTLFVSMSAADKSQVAETEFHRCPFTVLTCRTLSRHVTSLSLSVHISTMGMFPEDTVDNVHHTNH